MTDDDAYRYPFPPLPKRPRPFPVEPPLSRGLAELAGLWLHVRCACNRGTAVWPLRLMAAQPGWHTPLSAVLPRLRCRKCNCLASSVELVEDPARGASGRMGSPPGPILKLI